MKELMLAIEELHIAQIELLKRWEKTYTGLVQQNQLLGQQVDYLQDKIALLERQLQETRLKEARENPVFP
ncbi:hypothetical protein NI416_004563 [Salmonella enterica]|nr:hypothetical protein [Salmonella enterica]